MSKVQRRGRVRADGFTRSVEEEVKYGCIYSEYKSKLAPFLLPRPGDTAEDAERAIRECRQAEAFVDPGAPGVKPPVWGAWKGTER